MPDDKKVREGARDTYTNGIEGDDLGEDIGQHMEGVGDQRQGARHVADDDLC